MASVAALLQVVLGGFSGLAETFDEQTFDDGGIGYCAGESPDSAIGVNEAGEWQIMRPLIHGLDELFGNGRIDLPECLGRDFVINVIESFVEPGNASGSKAEVKFRFIVCVYAKGQSGWCLLILSVRVVLVPLAVNSLMEKLSQFCSA